MNNANNWLKYQELVLAELKRHSMSLNSLEKHLNKIEIEIAMLKLKSGIWGMLGAAIPLGIAMLVELIRKT